MKASSFILIVSLLALALSGIFAVVSNYQYERDIQSHWELADKASTVIKKSEHMDNFVLALDEADLGGQHNAVLFKTPDNNFDLNLEALETLQTRLHEIQTMDVTSFEYQTAMQQITGQEQGEANDMLYLFRGVWYKEHYVLLWNWIGATQILLFSCLLLFGLLMKIDL